MTKLLVVCLFFLVGCGVSRPFPEQLKTAPVYYMAALPEDKPDWAVGYYVPFCNLIYVKKPLSIFEYIRLISVGLNKQDIVNHEYAHALDYWVFNNRHGLWVEFNDHRELDEIVRLEEFADRVVKYLKGKDDVELENYLREIENEKTRSSTEGQSHGRGAQPTNYNIQPLRR